MDEDDARGLGINIPMAQMPVNIRGYHDIYAHEEPINQYIPFNELMKNISRQKSASSSSSLEEQSDEEYKSVFKKTS